MWAVLLLSFLAGFAVMQVELVAPRLVAPLLGSTQLTWSAVFAVFLGALAAGNAVGGRLADRGGRRTLPGMFAISLLLVAVIVPLAQWLGQGVLDGLPHGLRTLTVVLLLFGPAAFALGLIGPALARAALALGSTPGRALGAVAAAGALGSMVGTLGTGLWLLGRLDLYTIVWCSVGICAVGVAIASTLPAPGARSAAEAPTFTPRTWLLLAALAGAALLIVEVAAGRLASRRLGSSIYTWTSVIATVLLGLGIGNLIGGRLAEREDRNRTLGLLFVVASVAVAACLWTPRLITHVASLPGMSWPIRVFLGCAVAFVLPSIALGTLSPVILRAALADPKSDGLVAGRIYAAGTIGAVLGSLLAGYVLLPAFGAPLLFVLLALLLALLPRWIGARIEVPWLITLAVIGFFIAAPIDGVASVGRKLRLRAAQDVHVVESRYFHIEVVPHDARWVTVPAPEDLRRRRQDLPAFGGRLSVDQRRGELHWQGDMRPEERDELVQALGLANQSAGMILFDRTQSRMRRLTLDGFVHGYADLDDPDWLEYDYEVLYGALVQALRGHEDPLSCFFIGGGCYTFQRYLMRHVPQVEMETAELDPAVTRVAIDQLGMTPDKRHQIHDDDARTVLRRSTSNFSLIFGDAFHDLAVPWHLTTREFTETVRSRLTEDGVYLINMIDVFSSGHFLRAYLDTLGEVFPNIRVLSMAPRDDNRQETFLIAASSVRLVWDTLVDGDGRELSIVEYGEADLAALRARTQPLILRDSFAPVEHLLAPVVKRRGAIERSR